MYAEFGGGEAFDHRLAGKAAVGGDVGQIGRQRVVEAHRQHPAPAAGGGLVAGVGEGQQVGGEARRVDEVGVEMHGDRAEGGHPLDHAGDGAIGQRRGKAEHPGVDFGGDAAAELDGEGGIAQRQQAGKPAAGRLKAYCPSAPKAFLARPVAAPSGSLRIARSSSAIIRNRPSRALRVT
jgi:hypothetical protein